MLFFQVYAVVTIVPMIIKNSLAAKKYGEDILAFSTYCDKNYDYTTPPGDVLTFHSS